MGKKNIANLLDGKLASNILQNIQLAGQLVLRATVTLIRSPQVNVKLILPGKLLIPET